MCVNAQGICHKLGEPKSKKKMYCINLKRHINGGSKEFGKNEVKIQKMTNVCIEILMQYVIGANK